MEKLKSGYSYIRVTAEDVEALADEMDQMVERYGWQDRTVMPWPSIKMTVAEITRNMRDYRRCTRDSKFYLIDLANGLVDVMNAWEAHELEPKMQIRNKKNGKICTISADIARDLIKEGYAEAV